MYKICLIVLCSSFFVLGVLANEKKSKWNKISSIEVIAQGGQCIGEFECFLKTDEEVTLKIHLNIGKTTPGGKLTATLTKIGTKISHQSDLLQTLDINLCRKGETVEASKDPCLLVGNGDLPIGSHVAELKFHIVQFKDMAIFKVKGLGMEASRNLMSYKSDRPAAKLH